MKKANLEHRYSWKEGQKKRPKVNAVQWLLLDHIVVSRLTAKSLTPHSAGFPPHKNQSLLLTPGYAGEKLLQAFGERKSEQKELSIFASSFIARPCVMCLTTYTT